MKLKTSPGAWRKGAAVLVALGTMSSLMLTQTGVASATGAGASTSPPVTVNATISGSGAGKPVVECSWILTDDNHLGGAETQQYSYAVGKNIGPYAALAYTNWTQPAQGLGWNGLDPTNAPSYGAVGNPAEAFQYGADDNTSAYLSSPNCTSLGTASSTPVQLPGSQASPVSTGIQVLPNLFDSPTNSVATQGSAPRRLEAWAAVDNATAVSFNVYYPDGKEDTMLGGVQIGPAQNACGTYSTTGSLLSNMFAQAGPGASNQIGASAIQNGKGSGIVDLCNDNEKSLWYQGFTLSKDDPNGTYTVEVIATNSAGNTDTYISFYSIPVYDLAIDFSSVDFISNNASPPVYFVSGSPTWGTPNFPTVTNGGNSGEEIGVNFGALTCTNCTGSPGTIQLFDADLGYNANDTLNTDVPATAGTTAWISNNGSGPATGAQLVCPNDTPKLDLSMEPPAGVQAGTYAGTLTVQAEGDPVTGTTPNGGCLTDNGAPYILAGSTGTWKSLLDSDPSPIVRD